MQLLEYKRTLDEHYQTLTLYFSLAERDRMPKPTVETLLVDPLLDLQKCLITILKDNGLLSSDSLLEQQKIAAILDSLVQI
jgi:hypothetical protein